MAEAGWGLFSLPDCAARRVDRARAGGRGIPPHAAWFELATAEVKASGLAQDVVKASEESRLQVLCAPVDGTVEQLAIHTIGDVVTPAEALREIVPLDSRLKSRRWCRTGMSGLSAPGRAPR